jgi:hypothetical protein
LVETPKGDIIDPGFAVTNPLVTYVEGSNVTFYRISLPLLIGDSQSKAGKWKAILSIDPEKWEKYLGGLYNYPDLYKELTIHGIRYRLNVHAYSNVRMRSTISQNSYESGATLTLHSILTQYGLPLTNRATVRAELRRPDNTITTLNLSESEPGVFETTTTASISGIYIFKIYCNGYTIRNLPFTREELHTAAVWPGGSNNPPGGRPSGGGDSTPGVKICELLECLFSDKVISGELQKRLLEFGINIDELQKCLKIYCKDTQSSFNLPFFVNNEFLSLIQKPETFSALTKILELLSKKE